MRCRRLLVLGLLTAVYAATAGCADSTSPAARAWERATIQARTTADPLDQMNLMAASDGLGGVVFAPENTDTSQPRRSTFAHVPEE